MVQFITEDFLSVILGLFSTGFYMLFSMFLFGFLWFFCGFCFCFFEVVRNNLSLGIKLYLSSEPIFWNFANLKILNINLCLKEQKQQNMYYFLVSKTTTASNVKPIIFNNIRINIWNSWISFCISRNLFINMWIFHSNFIGNKRTAFQFPARKKKFGKL